MRLLRHYPGVFPFVMTTIRKGRVVDDVVWTGRLSSPAEGYAAMFGEATYEIDGRVWLSLLIDTTVRSFTMKERTIYCNGLGFVSYLSQRAIYCA